MPAFPKSNQIDLQKFEGNSELAIICIYALSYLIQRDGAQTPRFAGEDMRAE